MEALALMRGVLARAIDPELGLLLKNTLDALDVNNVLEAPPGPLRLLSALRASLQA